MMVGRGSEGATGRAEEHAGSNISVCVKKFYCGRPGHAASLRKRRGGWQNCGRARGLAPPRPDLPGP
eukprot:42989-Prymnesium_polylepis.1